MNYLVEAIANIYFVIEPDDYGGDFKGTWKIPVLFGSLKKYCYLFWSYAEIRKINEDYHSELERINRFPIRYLHLWRKKVTGIEVNSFFVDLSKDAEYLLEIISKINHNTRLLYEITEIWKKFDWKSSVKGNNKKKKSKAVMFFEEVTKFVDANKNLISPLPYEHDRKRFNSTFLIKTCIQGNMIIEAAKKGTSIDYFPSTENGQPELAVFESKLQIKNVDKVKLTDKSLYIIRHWLKGLEDIDLETGKNLLNNYKYYVEEKNYKKFEKACRDGELLSYSIFESFSIDYIIEVIRKYYSYVVAVGLDKKKMEQDEQTVTRTFKEKFHNDDAYGFPVTICYFIDILGYFYKKGFYFLEKEAYLEMNAVMRAVFKDSNEDWYCFDPSKGGEWYKYYDEEKCTFNSGRDTELCIALKYIIERRIIVSSSLLLDAFDIAKTEHDFRKAKTKIGKVIKAYIRDLDNRIKYF